MSTRKRELRKLIESLFDEYGVLCTFQHSIPLEEAIADVAVSLFAPKRTPPKPPAENLYPLVRALSEVCSIDLEANKSKLFAEAKRLNKATPHPTYDLIVQHYRRGGTWYTEDWRGMRGDRPQLGQVRLTWAQIVRECPSDIQGLDAPSTVPVI